jgi:MFS family permease
VFALPAGLLADRFDRKRLMISCDLIRMLAAASIVIGLLIGRPPLAQIYTAAFLDGALFVVSYVCERGAMSQIVPAEQLHDRVAQNQARMFGAGILGPSLGGVLFSAARALPFVADAASFLISMLAIGMTRKPFQGDRKTERQREAGVALGSEIAAGLLWLREHRFFGATSLLFAAGNPFFTGTYLLAILLARHRGASPAGIGFMFAIIGAGGVVGALAAPAMVRRLTTRFLIVGSAWVPVMAVLGLFLARDAVVIGLLIAAAEFATPSTNAAVSAARIVATPDGMQGRVQAATTMISMSLSWLGPLAVGACYQYEGPTATICVIGGWTLLLAGIAMAAPALRLEPALVNDRRDSPDAIVRIPHP